MTTEHVCKDCGLVMIDDIEQWGCCLQCGGVELVEQPFEEPPGPTDEELEEMARDLMAFDKEED